MSRHLWPVIICLLTGCASSVSDAGDPAMTTRTRLSRMVEDDLPGVQYVVVDRRGVRFEAALGVRDVASGQPMQHDTLQMAYSISKAVAAIAALELVQEGRLDLERPLDRYFADHPYGASVTIRTLLAQTSGVPNPMPLDWLALDGEGFDRERLLAGQLRDHGELDHPAGAEYGYSNLSYWLLEQAIERASGSDYADYVANHVLAPLAITPEQARYTPGPPEISATGHAKRYALTSLVVGWMSPDRYWAVPSGSWRRSARVVPHGRAYGGLFTSARVLGELLRDLLREDPLLLEPATRRLMLSQQQTNDGEPIPMTLGWILGELKGQRYFGKQGGGLGFHGNVRIYLELGLATVLLANATELSPGPIDARSDTLDEPLILAEVERRRAGG